MNANERREITIEDLEQNPFQSLASASLATLRGWLEFNRTAGGRNMGNDAMDKLYVYVRLRERADNARAEVKKATDTYGSLWGWAVGFMYRNDINIHHRLH